MKLPITLVAVAVLASCNLAPSRAQNAPAQPPAQPAAPDTVLPGRPDAAVSNPGAPEAVGVSLAPAYESKSAGISLQPPAGAKPMRGAMGSDQIVQFLDDARKWKLTVTRTILSKPLPLVINEKDANRGPGANAPALPKAGMLDITAGNMRGNNPDAEILRQDVTTLGEMPVGLIAARYSVGTETRLHQQALVQASDSMYFILEMTSPAPKAPADVTQDPQVQLAVATFNRVLDTVKLLDQTQLLEDQKERLYRTRAFYVNLTDTKLRNTLVPEQWWRLIKDGKDVGYCYVVEEIAQDLPKHGAGGAGGAGGGGNNLKQGGQDGVLVGVRSRTLADENVQMDTESWMWVSLDRRHEIWSSIAHRLDKKTNATDRYGEFGSSDSEIRTVVDENLEPGERLNAQTEDKKQPPARQQEIRRLRVAQLAGKGNNAPVERRLPPFYLPQAMGHLLPRVLPRWEPKGYLFASYVTDQHEVAKRYVDVGDEREVTLGGQKLRAIAIKDRIGLEGSVTTHYVSPEGAFLGSVNEDSKLTILPTDRPTLEKMWANADLTRPADVDPPK